MYSGSDLPSDDVRELCSRAIVFVPTLNAGGWATEFTQALLAQEVKPRQVLIVDSESSDGSPAIFKAAGFLVAVISRDDFDHGGTRNYALELCPDADFIIFLTQDAILADQKSLAELLKPFLDPNVGCVYGRQLPRANAVPIERHAREFNYPGVGIKRTLSSVTGMGIKAVFNSNSFAAYRRSALQQLGGFPQKCIIGEDHVTAGRMLLDGWAVCYAPDATVVHSHALSIIGEFRRYFDQGVLHNQNPWMLFHFGSASSEGLRFVKSELQYLLHNAPSLIPEACIRTGMKLVAYRLGRIQDRLPHWLPMYLALNRAYFASQSKQSRGSVVALQGRLDKGQPV